MREAALMTGAGRRALAWLVLVASMALLVTVSQVESAHIGYAAYRLTDSDVLGYAVGGAAAGALSYVGGVWGAARLGARIGALAGGALGAAIGGLAGGL